MPITEIDPYNKAMIGVSAELGVVCFRRERPLVPGSDYALEEMQKFFESALEGPKILEPGPQSLRLVSASQNLLQIGRLLNLPPDLDHIVGKTSQLKQTTANILAGQPSAETDLEQLEEFLHQYYNHYHDLIIQNRCF